MTRPVGAFAQKVPQFVCPCGDQFWTRVGLDAHTATGAHRSQAFTRRWTTGYYSPAGLAVQQQRGRQIAAENNSRRRQCSCGVVSTPAGIGNHQKMLGHVGAVDLPT